MIKNLSISAKTVVMLVIISVVLLILLIPDSCRALISVSSKDVDTLPEKIYDDLVISDIQSISTKLNEISGDLILSAEKINIMVKPVSYTHLTLPTN